MGLEGLAELPVKGLPESEARLLLSSVAAPALELRMRERIVLEARGNPLALVELGRELAEEPLSVERVAGSAAPDGSETGGALPGAGAEFAGADPDAVAARCS